MKEELKKKLLMMGISGMAFVAIAHLLLISLKAPNPNPKTLIFGYVFTALITFAGLILRVNSVMANKPTGKPQSEEEIRTQDEEE